MTKLESSTILQDKDIILGVSISRKKIETLRTSILNSFKRPWLYVYKNDDGNYELAAANYWGSKLDEKTAIEMKKFSDDFFKENEIEGEN